VVLGGRRQKAGDPGGGVHGSRGPGAGEKARTRGSHEGEAGSTARLARGDVGLPGLNMCDTGEEEAI
jgi:hypothetical protein